MIREEDKPGLRKFCIQASIIFICVLAVSAYCLFPGGDA